GVRGVSRRDEPPPRAVVCRAGGRQAECAADRLAGDHRYARGDGPALSDRRCRATARARRDSKAAYSGQSPALGRHDSTSLQLTLSSTDPGRAPMPLPATGSPVGPTCTPPPMLMPVPTYCPFFISPVISTIDPSWASMSLIIFFCPFIRRWMPSGTPLRPT